MISNKTLAMLVLASIIMSIGGTILSINKLEQARSTKPIYITNQRTITGLATDPGVVNFSIGTILGCTASDVDFGTGTQGAITIGSDKNQTNGFNNCTGTGSACEGMVINNTGNINAYINFSSNVTGTTFPGGPSAVNADFRFWVKNGTAHYTTPTYAGCLNGTAPLTATDVTTASTTICTNLSSTQGANIMAIEYNITLRADTTPAPKSAGMLVSCT